MKIIMESFAEIQDFKNAVNVECDKMVKELTETFAPKRIEILKQIDEYLLRICEQLKDKKSCLSHQGVWYFKSAHKVNMEIVNNTYLLRVNINQYDIYDKEVCQIKNGELIFENEKSKKNESRVAETIIKDWQSLKQNITETIMCDLQKSQEIVNKRIDEITERNDLYNNFVL